MSGLALGLAYLMDLIIGDPPWFPHPVRLIGWLIHRLAAWARPWSSNPWPLRLAGMIIVILTVGLTWLMVWFLLRAAGWFSPWLSAALSVFLAYTALAAKSLYVETWRAALALKDGDLPRARRLLSLVVGRDTADLERAQILRALVETVAENLSDGVIAPFFYLALGGPALGLAYKAVNTLDSMIGYKAEPYRHLGWAAARLDDLAGLLPARITAAVIVLAAFLLRLDARGALRIWLRDGGRHDSPNAGRPEAALAGALGVQLGGTNLYRGLIVVKPTLGEARAPLSLKHLRQAEEVLFLAGGLMCLAVVILLEAW
ncbi:MAG: adenosylcobinamide-phosphate synthase CbiB [Pseudomonadota bacterium]